MNAFAVYLLVTQIEQLADRLSGTKQAQDTMVIKSESGVTIVISAPTKEMVHSEH